MYINRETMLWWLYYKFLFHYEIIYEMGPQILEKQVQSHVASFQSPRRGAGVKALQ